MNATALHWACIKGFDSIVSLLLQYTPPTAHNNMPGLSMIDVSPILYLLPVRLQAHVWLSCLQRNDWTPLHCVCYYGHYDALMVLLNYIDTHCSDDCKSSYLECLDSVSSLHFLLGCTHCFLF